MSEIKRRKNESFEGFMRRSKRAWQHSGRIIQAKKIKFFTEKKSKNERRRKRVAYIQKQGRLAYLLKTGKLSQDQMVEAGTGSQRKTK